MKLGKFLLLFVPAASITCFPASGLGQAILETVPDGEVPAEVGRAQASACDDFPTLFEYPSWNYGQSDSWQLQLQLSAPSLRQPLSGRVGSACVPPNWRLELYEREEYDTLFDSIEGVNSDRGSARYFNFSDGSGLNSQISSVRVLRYDSHDNRWVDCEAVRHCRF
ncbi:MAG: hypothetical protein AAF289_05420 [Cyanobacteria bacterium P01_A01_bin.135]